MSDDSGPPPPAPPPPPSAPPPPSFSPAPSGGGEDRSALLSSIQGFSTKNLKKAVTRDASTPSNSRPSGPSGGPSGGPNKSSGPVGGSRPPPQGGIGGVSSDLFGPGGVKGARSALKPAFHIPGPVNPGQKQTAVPRNVAFPKPNNRGSLFKQFNEDPDDKPSQSSQAPKPSPVVQTPAPKPSPVVQQPPAPKPSPVVQQPPAPKPSPVVQQPPAPKPSPVVQQPPAPKPSPVVQQPPKQETPKPSMYQLFNTPIKEEPRQEAPKPQPVYEAPKPQPVYETPKPQPVYEAPKPSPVVQQPPKQETPRQEPPKQTLFEQFNYAEETPNYTLDSAYSCYSCKGKITGAYFEALGHFYHTEHWACVVCSTPLGNDFYAPNQQPHCENCYVKTSSKYPPCGKCNKNITESYLIRDGKPYHVDCLNLTCHRCNSSIRGESVRALESSFHPHCFTCFQCNRPLGDSFIEKNGNPWCFDCGSGNPPSDNSSRNQPSDYQAPAKGSLSCEKCFNPISDSYMEIGGKKYHNHCFTCAECGSTLGSTFYELKGRSVCQKCMTSQAACAVCFKPLTGQFVEAIDKKFHPHCFKCFKCATPLEEDFYEVRGNVACEKCA